MLFLLSFLLVYKSLAHPDGAGNCLLGDEDLTSFLDHHGPSLNQKDQGGLLLKVSSPNWNPGCSYGVSLCAGTSPFKGFLVRITVQGEESKAVGSFKGKEGVSLMRCRDSSLSSAVTHTTTSLKVDQQVTWTAPTNLRSNLSTLEVKALVVREGLSDWYLLSSLLQPSSLPSPCREPTYPSCPSPQEDHSEHLSGEEGGMSHSSAEMSHGKSVFSTKWSDLVLLFSWWTTKSTQAYVTTLIILYMLAILVELLNVVSPLLDARLTSPTLKQALGFATRRTSLLFFMWVFMQFFMSLDVGVVIVLMGGFWTGSFLGIRFSGYYLAQLPVVPGKNHC